MFDNFPKERPDLPPKYQEIYSTHYKSNREGASVASSLSQKMEAWLHRKVAGDVVGIHNKSTLEIGAGTLNQLKYEQTRPYDIIEPFTELFKNSESITQIDNIYKSIDEISTTKKYDRITSIATFEHITNLPKVVATTCLLLNENGTLRTSIPNEGTFLWKLGYTLTTGIEFWLRYNLEYNKLMSYEHVNTADEIEQILEYFYGRIKCSCFGLNKKIAFYRFYECSQPKIEIAEQYLKSVNSNS